MLRSICFVVGGLLVCGLALYAQEVKQRLPDAKAPAAVQQATQPLPQRTVQPAAPGAAQPQPRTVQPAQPRAIQPEAPRGQPIRQPATAPIQPGAVNRASATQPAPTDRTSPPAAREDRGERIDREPGDRAAAGREREEISPERAAIDKTLEAYADAFNKKDAKALAALWAEKGVYVNKETGEKTEGREAIEKDFEEILKDRAARRMAIDLNDVRLIKPDVAVVDGQAAVSSSDAEPTRTAFSAVFIKQDDKWLVDSVHETTTPTPPTPKAALADLEWLVGSWVDDSDEASVTTSVNWSPNEAFLIRSFRVQLADDDEPREGTQVIGWDPRHKQIRSWTFDSDGSFGEGTWSKNGDDWLVRMGHTQWDGQLTSGTQVISRVDNNTVSVHTIGSEVDGEPVPAGEPVTVRRVGEQAAQK